MTTREFYNTKTSDQKGFLQNLMPTSIYTPFLITLNLFALSVCFIDPKGIPIFILILMFTISLRVSLTRRAEQKRTNALLEQVLNKDRP